MYGGGLMQLVAYGAQDFNLTSNSVIAVEIIININLLEYIKIINNNDLPYDINNIIVKYYLLKILNKRMSNNLKIFNIEINKNKIYRYLNGNNINCDYLVIKQFKDILKNKIILIMNEKHITNFEFKN